MSDPALIRSEPIIATPGPALIGITCPHDRFLGRWLHRGGHPEQLIPVLRRIWRDTFARDTAALAAELLAHDWLSLTADTASGRQCRNGVGYSDPDSDQPWPGRLADPVNWALLWLYLIDLDTDTIDVHTATAGQWLPHSRHPLDPDRHRRTLGCGGHTDRGHHWIPATICLPGPPEAVFTADTCPAPHPAGIRVARLTDPTADALAHTTRTQPTMSAYLRRTGPEFDLVWATPTGVVEATRLPRDTDGHLVVATPWWPWPAQP